MNENIKPAELFIFIGMFIAMIGFLLYGFLAMEVGQMDNCWSNYSTEQEAIMNCEGKNE